MGTPQGFHVSPVHLLRQFPEQILVLPQPLGSGGQAGCQSGIFLLQKGHDPVAKPVPQKFTGVVGAVCHIAQPVILHIGFHFLPGHVQHRPDQPVSFRCNAAQAPQAAAPEQVHQHRFGVVIRGVGGGDGSIQATQESVSCLSCGGFHTLGSCHDLSAT